MPERPEDPALEQSTNRWMAWGFVIMVLMVAFFPVYRWYEPATRDEAREAHLDSLAEQGASIYSFNCASCHGANGEGGFGPALYSEQFLTSANDDQITALIAVGVPGSQMNAYSIDFGGPLTSEQITAVTTYLRSLEDTAPDVPNWLDPLAAQTTTTTAPAPTTTAASPTTTAASPTTTVAPPTTAGGEPDEETLALGKEVYERTDGNGCAVCHGIDAAGGGGGPGIIGATESAIDDALEGGVSQMSFIELTDEELSAVALYLESLSD